MSYQVLARKWRPNTFSELVGQEHVVAAITNALDNNRLHHAYLFTGTRGVGKTTIARIFAKSLNCEQGMGSNPCGVCPTCKEIEQGNFVDLLEIDAASRTKVEDTRELLDNVQYKPARAQYKVYLIDEVHMLSRHSFNALLKTLEEPPPHVKFLLATTDPQKLPITILSRCLQFTLKALTREQIQTQLAYILEQENLIAEPAALHELARAAQGSMRDSLSLTDQAIAQGNGEVSAQVVADMLGLLDRNVVLKLLHAILKKDKNQVLKIVDDLSVQAPDFGQLLGEIMSYLHQIALTQFVPEACKLETHAARAVFTLAKSVPPEQVQMLYQVALQGRKDLPHAVEGRIGLEMTLLRMLAFAPENPLLQADDVAALFDSLPKTSLTTLEQERKQAQAHQPSLAQVDPVTVAPLLKANSKADSEANAEISAATMPEAEKKTQPEAVSDITETGTVGLESAKTSSNTTQVETAADAMDSALVSGLSDENAVDEPAPALNAEQVSETHDAAVAEELNAEQESLFEQADTMLSEAFGSNDKTPEPHITSPAETPDIKVAGDQHINTRIAEPAMGSPGSATAPTPEVSHLSQPHTAQMEVLKGTDNSEAHVSNSPGREAITSQSIEDDDPQLADAYALYLSAMPDTDEEYAEPDVFDPASLVSHANSALLSATPATSSHEAQETEQDEAAKLINTEELLALRTQISDNIQEATDDEKDIDEGTEAINRALKNNVPSQKTGAEELSEQQAQVAQASSSEAQIPETQTSETPSGHLSTSLSTSLSKNSQSHANAASEEQASPPWETAHSAGTQTPGTPSEHTDSEYPVEYYQQFIGQSEQPDESGPEPVFVDTRSGWLPGMDEPAAQPHTVSGQNSNASENTQSDLQNDDDNDFTSFDAQRNPACEDVDFDIPYQLNDGKKVVKASQLDTWSQLIESMGLSGLTKQVAIHSMYKMSGNDVQLTLAEDKKHLVGPKTTEHLTDALTQALRHDVSVNLDYGEVTDTPFAVQQAINRMRMQHAHKTIAADPQVQLLCQTFNAQVISESIKPK